MKKLLFLTPNNLSTNPRLLKEIQLAQNNYSCTVIAFNLNNRSDEVDEVLRRSLQEVSFEYINAGRKPFLPWLLSSVIERASRMLYPLSENSLKLNAYGHSKRSWLLNKKLKSTVEQYDLVIAHNPAALYPAYLFAQKRNIPFAFDMEDYHPGERAEADAANEKLRREFLLKKILPKASYISYASPLFCNETRKLVHWPVAVPQPYIPNSFSETEFILPAEQPAGSKLKLVWFSQHINSHRGLEEIIAAAEPLKNDLEIHLIGQLNPSFSELLAGSGDHIFIHPPMDRLDLHRELSKYDIGLAIEMSRADANREMALTNKIYAYAQAGLLVLATDTKGQTWFAQQYPGTCILTGQKPAEIRQAVASLLADKENIRRLTYERFSKSRALSLEQNAGELLKLWN